jgi:AraC-like DNA-binding protein
MIDDEWRDWINPQVHIVWSGTWRTGTVEPGRVLIDHELVLVSRGRCQIEFGDQTCDVPAGGFVIVPPGVPHLTRITGGPTTRHCIHFDWQVHGPLPAGKMFRYLPDRPPREHHRPAPAFVSSHLLGSTLAAAAPDRAATLAQRITAAWKVHDRDSARVLTLELLLSLCAPTRARPRPERTAELAQAVKDRLDNGGLDERSMRSELQDLGYSYEHLCRAFTRTFGLPPVRYVMLARVEHAKELLTAPGATVADVAKAVGYRDPAYFARVFKQLTGSPPSLRR